ncbi:MarR family transcriptional regulator [Fulvivirga sp. RKSG066]|uniref:MarR family winged helix-turn-helix transcriptional regulator n=1 Tax=Fulvivirga aurantia TaxID=2529383 RepID=UPI0012BBC7F1|nr:MarR family transcriptional regulator [Fulvivirga aurantia]MTI22349.1 MarR family transcriptional regulator [Fulvivirga aurantia]
MRIEDEIKQDKFHSEQQKVTINLLYTSSWITNKHKEFFKSYNITPQQYNVLRILRGQHPQSISTSAIKDRMLDRNSDVSRIVDRLTTKQLVSKSTCPDDRRLVDVVISDNGLLLLKKMDKAVEKLDTTVNLNEEEAKKLNELLDKVRS